MTLSKEKFLRLSEPKVPPVPKGWHTARELAEQYGMSEGRIRRRLARLLENGDYQMRRFPELRSRRVEMIPRYAPASLQSRKGRSTV